jgi:hypothetical protein
MVLEGWLRLVDLGLEFLGKLNIDPTTSDRPFRVGINRKRSARSLTLRRSQTPAAWPSQSKGGPHPEPNYSTR